MDGEPTFRFHFQSARAATISGGGFLFDDHARSKGQMGHHYSFSQSITRCSPVPRASRVSSNYNYDLQLGVEY